jgi:hypothetical protein
MVRTTFVALASVATVAALALMSAASGASARKAGAENQDYLIITTFSSRAPQPAKNLPSTTNRDMRMAPSVGGMRGGMGGARMTGGVGRR